MHHTREANSVQPESGTVIPAERPFPSRLQVEVTSRCNMRCVMCMKQAEGCDIPDQDLSFDLFKKLAPALPGCEALVLSGIGEPLLHPLLPDMASFAHERLPVDAMLGFQTNALALQPELAKRLILAGVNTLCISVDTLDPTEGTGELHGQGRTENLARTFTMLRRTARENGRELRLGVEFVLMADTWRQLPQVVAWAARHGASFVIVSHLMAYHADMRDQTLFNPNTPKATAIFERRKTQARTEGLNLHDYLHILWKFKKTSEQQRLTEIVRCMQKDAADQGVWIHLQHLLEWDKKDVSGLREVYGAARATARKTGMELRLPPLQAVDERHCHFVEQGVAFVTSQGDVSPCQLLWHRTSCHMDGQQKHIRPWLFGNLREATIREIWQSPQFSDFRRQVLQYEYPYCSNCTFVPCDDIIGKQYPFEYDCLGNTVPCGHCMWCMGGLQCLL